MNTWTTAEAKALTAPEEVQIAVRRSDGTLRPPTTIWIVVAGDRVFVRSTNGRTSGWFQRAVTTGTGRITTGKRSYDVIFHDITGPDLDTVDAGYRTKYRRYASIVDHLNSADPRAATLEVRLA